jgi:GNAT superfamily N-acetyltransferase
VGEPASGVETRLRVATDGDREAIDALMKDSTRALFPAFYDERQTASSVIHIAHVDPQLIADGTYFVIEAGDAIVACGGWSRRAKLFSGSADQEGRAGLLDPATQAAHVRAMFVRGDWTRRGLGTRILQACATAARAEGFTRLDLMATLPGVPLYERFGFVGSGPITVTLPDGVEVGGVPMEMAISDSAPGMT